MNTSPLVKHMLLLLTIFFTIHCTNVNDPDPPKDESQKDTYITGFDTEGMRKKHLSDFTLVRKRARWNEGREFVYRDVNDNGNLVLIRIGIHSSKSKALEIAEEYNRGTSLVPQEDSLGFGDRSWWMPDVDSPDTVAYHFLRNNMFVIVNSHTYDYLLNLTRAIDEDIVNGTDYIKKSNSISLPIIHSVSASKTNVREGESTKITINASDPSAEPLEHVSHPGLIHFDSDPPNVFTFIASRDYVPAPFWGSHIFNFIVFNESNVSSEIAELEIEISQ